MANSNTIHVAIVDDHVLFRTGVKTAVSNSDSSTKGTIKMIAEADNGSQLLSLMRGLLKPDVVLLNLKMGELTMMEMKKIYPGVGVIMMVDNECNHIARLMSLGANSCLTKKTTPAELIDAIRAVYEKGYYFNDMVDKALLEHSRKENGSAIIPAPNLSDKETTYLKELFKEKSLKEIALILGLSHRSVEAIRDKIKTKTNSISTAGLVIFALKAGIVTIEDAVSN